ncbi:unnamed protein product [Urochloa humidicola]
MEGWRALAEIAPRTCFVIALDTGGRRGLFATVDGAHRMLDAVVQTLAPASAADVPADAFPYALLEGAHRLLACFCALHAGSGYVCELYAQRALAHPAGSPPYVSWQGHFLDADRGAGDAMKRLRLAASEARAAEAALRVSRSFPRGSHVWADWRASARRLALYASISAAAAFSALRRMHNALVLECLDARRILNLNP